MDTNFVIVAALGIFGVLLIICAAIIWRAFEGMKNFLRDNVTEVLIVAGDEIVGRLQNLHNALNSLTANIPQTAQTLDLKKLETELSNLNNAVQETSKILRVIADGIKSLKDETLASQNAIGEKLGNAISQVQTNSNAAPVNDSAILGSIVSELQALKQVAEKISGFCDKNDLNTTIQSVNAELGSLSSIISESSENLQTAIVGRLDDMISQIGNKPEYDSSSVNDLSEKIAALSEELGKLPEKIQNSAITNFESEIKTFTDTVKNMSDDLTQNWKVMNKKQHDLIGEITNMTSKIQSVLTKGTEDIKSRFADTNKTLENMINSYMQRILKDYENNAAKIFQNIADNLAEIIRREKQKNGN